MYDDGYQDSVTLDDLLEDGRYDEAAEALAAFVAEYPDEVWAYSVRALCLAELGRRGEAVALAEEAAQAGARNPKKATAWFARDSGSIPDRDSNS